MTFTVRKIRGRNPWLVKPFAGRDKVIAGVMIHCTRGGSTDPNYDDLVGTENWAQSSANGSAAQGWGSYWDEVIGRRTGERVISTDWDNEYASWCAGYGGAGTWAAGIYYIQIEVCQSRIDQPFTDVQIESAAESVGMKARRYGFPIQRIPYLAQTGTPPKGICTHEDSANGRKTGKSDPGPLFPWAHFLERARHYAGEVDEVDPRLEEMIWRMVDLLLGAPGQTTDAHGDRLKRLQEEVRRERPLLHAIVNQQTALVNHIDGTETHGNPMKEIERIANELARHTAAPHTADGIRDDVIAAFTAGAATMNGEQP